MLRIRKNSFFSKSTHKAQTAIEYLLLLSVVTAIVLVAFNGDYLGRVHNAANLYFDRVAVGIYGDAAACGDDDCKTPYENHINCPADCLPPPEEIIPIQCEVGGFYSGTCGQEISIKDFPNGTKLTGPCPEECNDTANSRQYEIECINGWLQQNVLCYPEGETPPGPNIGGDCPAQTIPSSNCVPGISVPAIQHNKSAEITCTSPCVLANPESKLFATCYNTQVSVSGICIAPEATDLSCPRHERYFQGNGCSGLIIFEKTDDQDDASALCPPGCGGGPVKAFCNKGTFEWDNSTLDCQEDATP